MVSVRPKHIFYDMTQVVSSLDTNNVAPLKIPLGCSFTFCYITKGFFLLISSFHSSRFIYLKTFLILPSCSSACQHSSLSGDCEGKNKK